MSGNKRNILYFDPATLAEAELPYSDSSYDVVFFAPQNRIFLIEKGFDEAARVLKPKGTLIFKWSDEQTPIQKVLKVINFKSLFTDTRGNKHCLIIDEVHDDGEWINEFVDSIGSSTLDIQIDDDIGTESPPELDCVDACNHTVAEETELNSEEVGSEKVDKQKIIETLKEFGWWSKDE